MPERSSGPKDPCERQPAGRSEGAAGLPFRLRLPGSPEALNYDTADEQAAAAHARILHEPGRRLKWGERWVGHVRYWWAGPWGIGADRLGWKRVIPCVVLVSCEGELLRVFGWDACDTFCSAAASEAGRAAVDGLDVHVRDAQSPDGSHRWWVIDLIGAGGEVPSEAIVSGETQPALGAGGESATPGAGGPPLGAAPGTVHP